MEEDLKILEEMFYDDESFEPIGYIEIFLHKEQQQAIKHLIQGYKELEEEIKRMKSLDIYKLVQDVEMGQLIHTSEVEEKIEELQKELEEKYSAEKISVFSGNTYMEKFKLLGKVQVLQELLEKRK